MADRAWQMVCEKQQTVQDANPGSLLRNLSFGICSNYPYFYLLKLPG